VYKSVTQQKLIVAMKLSTKNITTYYYGKVTPAPYSYTQGLPTASLVRIRDQGMSLTSADRWVTSVYFYDQKGHLIQTQSLNPFNALSYSSSMAGTSGNWDVLTTEYSFTGQKLQDILFYNDSSTSTKPTTLINNYYQYDNNNNGRLTNVYQSLDGGGGVVIAAYTYNSLGQVTQKSLGGVEIQNYDYSIRGQLTGSNRDYTVNGACSAQATTATFGEILDYDYGFTSPRYDGSISGMLWRGAGSAARERAYGYNYDPANRLTGADFREYCTSTGVVPCGDPLGTFTWNKTLTDYTASNQQYDLNGNLLTMNQRGTYTSGPVNMDQLSYYYLPGTTVLNSVHDTAVTTGDNLGDFQDVYAYCGNAPCPDYAYDYGSDSKELVR